MRLNQRRLESDLNVQFCLGTRESCVVQLKRTIGSCLSDQSKARNEALFSPDI